jgi:hypothetical protein
MCQFCFAKRGLYMVPASRVVMTEQGLRGLRVVTAKDLTIWELVDTLRQDS